MFADAGYDVWLPNSRGNFYSRNHVTKDPNVPFSGFWRFSWYELGVYDYPAVINYVRQETQQEKVYYIAHSQGTSGLMTLLSERPEYNQFVAAASLLAPIGYMSHLDTLSHTVGDMFLLFQV